MAEYTKLNTIQLAMDYFHNNIITGDIVPVYPAQTLSVDQIKTYMEQGDPCKDDLYDEFHGALLGNTAQTYKLWILYDKTDAEYKMWLELLTEQVLHKMKC